ncbi:hypothetical protein ACFQI7_04210 [Paenibacillus allorhizosphaerae]|uniref:Uncharacterized protein n=1 Tax=Paenibacillus allorhizosphaerae TaxID=2849866 RepID=A0ABM8VCD1_9BACL|nr:hypothetical protein [Paenibacillus allorhizosphaerae]CAG7623750.1 hypothetical protein PAECIP111802_00983 [Paenibacillus allorhizosphaerae]
MMIGSIRWNFIVGGIAFFLTFLLSIGSNIWLTTFLRSLYSFLFLFVLVFGFRYLLGTFAGLNGLSVLDTEPADEEGKGTSVDALTPDEEEELHLLLKQSMNSNGSPQSMEFSPLNPPKLSTKVDAGPEELAQAVRRMSED